MLLAMMVFAATAFNATFAQEQSPKLTVKPEGRILMDAAAYAGNTHDLFKGGAAIPDVRLGAAATYGKWAAKVDIGYAYGKVGLKDIYFQYTFDDKNILRAGSFIHQYGLQTSTSSSMKCTMEEPTSNEVFNTPRLLGMMYEYNGDKFLATASAHFEPNSTILTPSQLGHQGYGLLSRLVWRPMHEDGRIFQIGVSGGFASPFNNKDDYGNKHHTIRFAGNFPTKVDQVSAVEATVYNAMNTFKFTPELLVAYGRMALEGQYFYNQVNRRQHLDAYKAQGAYGIFRGVLLGGNYSYNMIDGGIAPLAPKSLEVCLGYNYTTLTDSKVGIHGGRISTVSCTFTITSINT